MGDAEFGQCDICRNDAHLQRTYYHYDIKCDCHSPQHFELVCHCSTCVPKPPTTTTVSVKPSPPSPSVEVSGGLEGQSIEAIELLKEYEQWEADLISDNAMWWPNVPKDRISGKTYDKMLELQAKRNQILKSLSSIKAEEKTEQTGAKYTRQDMEKCWDAAELFGFSDGQGADTDGLSDKETFINSLK